MSLVSSSERLAWFQAARNVTLSAAQVQFLDTLQPWVEQACYQVVGCTLEQSTYTEFLPTSGGERPPLNFGIDIGWDMVGGVAMPRSRTDPIQAGLQLSRRPARSIASVYENLAAWSTGAADGNWPASNLLPATAYRLDLDEPGLSRNARLIRVVGLWPTIPRTVKVTYVHGYSAAELSTNGLNTGPLKLAVLDSLGWWWGKAMRRSASIRSNMLLAFSLTIRDFNAQLGDPSGLGQPSGDWATAILSPEALNILTPHLSLAKYVGG